MSEPTNDHKFTETELEALKELAKRFDRHTLIDYSRKRDMTKTGDSKWNSSHKTT